MAAYPGWIADKAVFKPETKSWAEDGSCLGVSRQSPLRPEMETQLLAHVLVACVSISGLLLVGA